MTEQRIVLVGPELEENLSLRYLSACLLRAGFKTEVVPFDHALQLQAVLGATLGESPPLMVALSLAFQRRAPDFLALALALRQAGYSGHVTSGGHFATFAWESLLTDFAELDSVCRQEAEETIVALARALADGTPLPQVDGLALRDAVGEPVVTPPRTPPDLASLPWPDRSRQPVRCFGHGMAPLVASRGCYAGCTFCCIAAWHALGGGPRQRFRDLVDVADEMACEHHDRGVDIFVFHDDNFFLPKRDANLERLNRLADLLEARGVRRFGSIIKARPSDADPEVFDLLRRRLRCLRAYVGIETDSDQGLKTLRRGVRAGGNQRAIDVVRQCGILACYNLLMFDPDVTRAGLEANVAFMERNPDVPVNFCRAELYAGTPLLERMEAEGRCDGDYIKRGYSIADPEARAIYRLAMAAFRERNFGALAPANRLMGFCFDVAVARDLEPDAWRPAWAARGEELTRTLVGDTARGLREVIAFVAERGPEAPKQAGRDLVATLSERLRATEARVGAGIDELEAEMAAAIAVGTGCAASGAVEVTPLQPAR